MREARRPIPDVLRPVAGRPVVRLSPESAVSTAVPYTARATVLTVQPAWWQHVMGVRGAFYLTWYPNPTVGLAESKRLGGCIGLEMAPPVTVTRLFDEAGVERRAVVRNHVWVLEPLEET